MRAMLPGHAPVHRVAAPAGLLDLQCGVVSRRQMLAIGLGDHDIARLVRRREWALVHPGVYVDHTGEPTVEQREWAAVLLHWPAALDGAAAARAHGLDPRAGDGPIEVVVDHGRRVVDPPGVRTRRTRHFVASTQMNLSPPRLRVQHTVLLLASRAANEDGAVAVLADACQRRRTTAERLRTVLADHRRLPRRALLEAVLADVATGAHSALERRYLVDVEQRHGLPRGIRQQPATTGTRSAFRDVEYAGLGTLVELDGRLGHDRVADRWADLDRDLAAAGDGRQTLRLGWRQVLAPCRVAAVVAAVLTARGWTGTPQPCSDACPPESRLGRFLGTRCRRTSPS